MKLDFSLFRTYKKTLFAASAYLWASLVPAFVDLLINSFLAKSYTLSLAVRNIFTPLFFILSDNIIGPGYTKTEWYNRIIGSVLPILLFKYLISNYGFTGATVGSFYPC